MFSKRTVMGMDGGCCIMRECPNPRICVLAISFVLIDEVRVEDEVLLLIMSVKPRHKYSIVSAGMICISTLT